MKKNVGKSQSILFFILVLALGVFAGVPVGNSQEMVAKARSALQGITDMDFGDYQLRPISGGLTNHIFLVDSPRYGKLVMRMSGQEALSLGINKEHQTFHTIQAGEMGVGPKVLFTSEDKSIMLIKFFPGASLTPERTTPEVLGRIAHILKKLHHGPAFLSSFNPFETLKKYRETARKNGVLLPKDVALASQIVLEIEETLSPHSSVHSGPCHNDIHLGNILMTEDEKSISVIDWDYSGTNDFFYDLAILSNSLNLDQEAAREMLGEYFKGEHPTAAEMDRHLAHLSLMRMVSDLWNSFWYFSQIGVSQIPFEHEKFALSSLDSFMKKAQSPQYLQWVKTLRSAETVFPGSALLQQQ